MVAPAPHAEAKPISLVRVHYLSSYLRAYEHMGGDARRLLHEVHLSPELLTSPEAFVPLLPVMGFVERATLEMGPTLGTLAAPQRLAEIGSFGRYLSAAPTLHDACIRLTRGVRAQGTGMQLELRDVTGSTWLCGMETMIGVRYEILVAQLERYTLGLMLLLVRQWRGEAWWPEQLWLQSAPWLGEHGLAAIPRLRHKAPFLAFQVAFDAPALDAGEPSREPALASDDVAPLDELDFVSSLIRLLQTLLPVGQVSLHEIAELVGTSARTLQRRLDVQHTTYTAVLVEVRQREAMRRLMDTEDTVTTIAYDLGYSDSAHFARAFRRWAGFSPLTVRRMHH